MDPDTTDWRKGKKTLVERLSTAFEKSILTDVVITVTNGNWEKKEFNAHQLILKCASPVFEAMFDSDTNYREVESGTLEIAGDPHTFGNLLEYVYRGKVCFKSVEMALDLIKVGHRYLMDNLMDTCLDYIYEKLDVSNVWLCYDTSKTFDLKQLEEKCLLLIQKNTSQLLLNASFSVASLENVCTLLDQPKLDMNECSLFKWVSVWLNKNAGDDKDEITQQIMPKFRFTSMTPEEFANGPMVSGLLTEKVSQAILTNLISSKPIYPYPAGYSLEKRNIEPVVYIINMNVNNINIYISGFMVAIKDGLTGELQCKVNIEVYNNDKFLVKQEDIYLKNFVSSSCVPFTLKEPLMLPLFSNYTFKVYFDPNYVKTFKTAVTGNEHLTTTFQHKSLSPVTGINYQHKCIQCDAKSRKSFFNDHCDKCNRTCRNLRCICNSKIFVKRHLVIV